MTFFSAFDTLFSCQGALIRSSCGTGNSGSADSSPLTREGRRTSRLNQTNGGEAASRITIAGLGDLAIPEPKEVPHDPSRYH